MNKANRPVLTKTPTEAEAKVLAYITKYIGKKGKAPTFDEIADDRGISKAVAFEHVTRLCWKGHLKKTGANRGIELVPRVLTTAEVEEPGYYWRTGGSMKGWMIVEVDREANGYLSVEAMGVEGWIGLDDMSGDGYMWVGPLAPPDAPVRANG